MCESREEIERSLSRLVRELDTDLLRGEDAKVLVGYFTRLERLAVAAKAICGLRVSSTGAFELEGHRHGAEWLAQNTGEALGPAVSLLEAAEKLTKLPELEDAFRAGELSLAQTKELAGAGAMDPGSLPELLALARSEDFESLRRRCGQVMAAKVSEEDEAAREKRLHGRRRLRTWTDDDGSFRLDARLTKSAGALVLARLQDEADKIFKDARRQGLRERSEAYLADALVSLCTREAKDGSARPRPKALVQLRVDLTALRRGNTGPGEICEIEGVGPVSVTTARELLGDSIASLLVTSATDVHAICNLGRSVPDKLYRALLERDRSCVVPGCPLTRNLEIDHYGVAFFAGGPTRLDNLARLCRHHHFLKTHRGFSLKGGPGAWIWVHPDGTSRQGASPRDDERDRSDTGPPGDLGPPVPSDSGGAAAKTATEGTSAIERGWLAEQALAAEAEQTSLFA